MFTVSELAHKKISCIQIIISIMLDYFSRTYRTLSNYVPRTFPSSLWNPSQSQGKGPWAQSEGKGPGAQSEGKGPGNEKI